MVVMILETCGWLRMITETSVPLDTYFIYTAAIKIDKNWSFKGQLRTGNIIKSIYLDTNESQHVD